MSKKNDTWMPLYIGDYLADTSRLTTEQHGAYLLILMDYWRNGPPLDDDEELATIAKLSAAQWRKHAPKIRALFRSTDGRLVQKRAEEERERAGLISDKRSVAGGKGAASKWKTPDEASGKTPAKTRSQRLAEARAKGRHTQAEWDALRWACGNRCVCCGISENDLEGGALTKDHIVPIYQGGDDSIHNIQPSCRNCNSRKGSDTTDYRETAAPGWEERLAERLANACQNGSQTPGPSQSQSHNTIPTSSGVGTSHGVGAVDNSAPPPLSADAIGDLLVKLEADRGKTLTLSSRAREALLRIADRCIDVPTLLRAHALACARRVADKDTSPVNPGFLGMFIDDALAERQGGAPPGADWDATPEGVQAKADALGVKRDPDEHAIVFRLRVIAASGDQRLMDREVSKAERMNPGEFERVYRIMYGVLPGQVVA